MHVQARAAPAASPADLAEFLKVLAASRETDRDAINVEGVSGAALERGGHLVFTVTHGRARDAHDRLKAAGYRVEWTWDVYAERIPPDVPEEEDPNQPGVLLGIVQRARETRVAGGRDIDTVLIGAFTNESGRFFVQVTFEDADWREDRPGEED